MGGSDCQKRHPDFIFPSRWVSFRLGISLLALLVSLFGGVQPVASDARPQDGPTVYLPVLFKPGTSLKARITKTTLSLPHPLEGPVASWCTWGWCTISPRLYQEPLDDGRTLVGWTDSSGDGHVTVLNPNGSLAQTFDFAGRSVHGLVAHADNKFALLLWNASAKTMWLSKRNADGGLAWETNITGPLTVFDPSIGDGRLAFGSNTYAAYFAVYGVSGWVQGHNGDQLTYVDSSGVKTGGWEWGCSHSMSELVSFHPTLGLFMPVCSSDCYASKAILINDSKVVYPCDGTCSGWVSAQLGQAALAGDTWKLVFNGMNRPGFVGKGIGLATINSAFQSSYIWLTNTTGDYERDPVIARIGGSLDADRFLVGWKTTNNNTFWLGVINASGTFIVGPEEVSSTGNAWGNRDDSFRTRADGRVSWVQGSASSVTLTFFVFTA
jgi:hypothetical protein